MAKWQAETDIPDFGEKLHGLEIEDGGHAVIHTVEDGADEGVFVQLRSWSNAGGRFTNDVAKLREAHPEFNQFAGRRVRVTIETLDELSDGEMISRRADARS